jgi:hypothetical protein
MSTEVRPDTERTPHQRPWSPAKRDELRERINAIWTPEKCDKMSQRLSALWLDPAYRAEMSTKMRAGHERKRLARLRTA